MLGQERLRSIIAECRGLDAETIAGTIADAAITWQEGRLRDDLAIVVLRVPPLGEVTVSPASGRAP
jgi:serine phosphatase RsbU (regulator of sigma subunit)